MQLKSDFVFKPLSSTAPTIHTPFPSISHPLGPLQNLPGEWHGTGFNVIWRPLFGTAGQDHFLELNLTDDTLAFEVIQGPIPNRGLLQADINMFGITYLQQIKDLNLGAGLHAEPGVWAVAPSTTNPAEPPTVIRMASIPHGTAILAQGVALNPITGPPDIVPIAITPFQIGSPAKTVTFPESTLSTASVFRSSGAEISGVTQSMLDNPNSILTTALAAQKILETTTLVVSSDPASPVLGGGMGNTAFLQGSPSAGPNAVGASVTATFWIEKVEGNPNPDFLQLQYSQVVLLNFNGLSWPHVTVATLRKTPAPLVAPELVNPELASNP